MESNGSEDPKLQQELIRSAVLWANSGERPEIGRIDETVVTFVGAPTQSADGSTWLTTTIGPILLSARQASVVGALIRIGPGASILDIPDSLQGEVGPMLDLGMLYVLNLSDEEFYRALIPRSLVNSGDQIVLESLPDSVFDFVSIRVPRGSGTWEFPAIVIPILEAIDGLRSAEDVVSQAINVFLQGINAAADDLSDGELVEVDDLRKLARLSIILAVQAGLLMLDISS